MKYGMTKKSSQSCNRFFSKCLVPVIVLLLPDRDLGCSLKPLVPVTQPAYQSLKLHSPPLLLPLVSSPAPHLILSSRCRHQSEAPTLSAPTTAVSRLLWTSLRSFYTCRNTPTGPTAPQFCSLLMFSFSFKKISLAVSSILNCLWLANEMFGSIRSS